MLKTLAVVGITLGLVGGAVVAGSPAPVADPDTTAVSSGRCPQIYAPVICDNGKVYPNQCEADRHHARNCVPLGI